MKKHLRSIAATALLLTNTFCSYPINVDGVGTFSEVLSQEIISKRVQELGAQIDEHYKDVKSPIILIGVLSGCIPFLSDLIRSINHSCELETIKISSYHGGMKSSGKINLKYDSLCERSLEGRHIIIVDDIIDSGLSMSWLVDHFSKKNPATIGIVSLIIKEDCNAIFNTSLIKAGFIRSQEFLIGYGLDYKEQFRNLPGIWALDQNK